MHVYVCMQVHINSCSCAQFLKHELPGQHWQHVANTQIISQNVREHDDVHSLSFARALLLHTLSVSQSVCLPLALSLSLSENMFVFTFAFVFAFLLDLHTQYITSARDNTHKHTQRVRWRDWESEVSRLACWWCVCVGAVRKHMIFVFAVLPISWQCLLTCVMCVCEWFCLWSRAHIQIHLAHNRCAFTRTHTHTLTSLVWKWGQANGT